MEIWEIVLLALVQGVTEFLPISSSGHIVALGTLLNLETAQLDEVTIALHFGTLLAICVVYFKQLCEMVSGARNLLWPLVLGSIPAGVTGMLVMNLQWEEELNNPALTGLMLIVTGLVLIFGRIKSKRFTDNNDGRVSQKVALLIGFSQAIAILPGISRSGMTIVTGRRLGLSAELSARFSFLLAIPIIGGASLITIYRLWGNSGGIASDLAPQQQPGLHLLLIGVTISAIVGWLSLRWLIRLLEYGNFHWFAYWCIPLGSILLIYSLYG